MHHPSESLIHRLRSLYQYVLADSEVQIQLLQCRDRVLVVLLQTIATELIRTNCIFNSPSFFNSWRQACLSALRSAKSTFTRTRAVFSSKQEYEEVLPPVWDEEPEFRDNGTLSCTIGVFSFVRFKVRLQLESLSTVSYQINPRALSTPSP